MNTRFLFVLSLIVAVFTVWFYRSQGELDSIINLSETNIEYQATDILAVQTNEEGVAEYSLTADDLTHYAAENSDMLTAMSLNWRPNPNRNVRINADNAVMLHEQSKVVMNNNVLFSSETADDKLSQKSPMILEAKELIGDLDKKQVYSNVPIVVTQADNSFEAEKFKADMQTGDYEFAKVAVTFMPPERHDKPLF